MSSTRFLPLLLIVLVAGGCTSAYYGTWEKLGWAKRDILVDRVEEARDEQQAAKEQIKTTLERFQDVTNFQGGNLEAKYKKLNGEYEDAKESAEEVRDRIEAVETVANDMFKEWKEELKQYNSDELRRSSEQKLNQTKERYQQLITVMKDAEAKMQPVLVAFNDQVLFLKHNLNAQAIASLQTTATQIEGDVAKLIADMEKSIAEANAFIDEMNKRT
ncbi:MAG: DUF2959 domain-containing protein [Opitutaceae bacterium]|nr:DUF2959 domain-containing protein [Opitutaceae bacterium]